MQTKANGDRVFNQFPETIQYRLCFNNVIAENELRKTFQVSIETLETDLAFLESYSNIPKIRSNAYLKINGFESIANRTVVDFFLKRLKSMDNENLLPVLYGLKSRIDTKEQLSAIKEIVANKNLVDLEKIEVTRAISKLELDFQPT